jgi:hypothetical protein
VLPGFAPAGELVARRVPKGATIVVEKKVPKPLTPRLASFGLMDAVLRRGDQLAEPVLSLVEGLKQGPPAEERVPPLGQTAGVGAGDLSGTPMKERGALYSV